MRHRVGWALGVLLAASQGSVWAAPILLEEGFDDLSSLVGWTPVYNSTPGGSTGWFQGNPGVFPAQSGADDSYIAANFLNAPVGGDISTWLLTPVLTLSGDTGVSFYTRSGGFAPDRLELRFSVGAGSDVGSTPVSVGTFTTLLLTINVPLLPTGYPDDWTQFTVTLPDLGGPTQGRFAFRYFVGDTSVNADYIGIDSLTITGPETTAAVPEPGTVALVGLGLLGLGLSRARRRS